MNNNMTMNVIKRNGKKEIVKMDKVLARIEKQCYGLDPNWVKPFEVAQKVIAGIYDGVTTVELDNLAVETSASLTSKHSDFAILASRLKISALYKDTLKSFSDATQKLYDFVNPETGEPAPLVSEQYYNIVMKNADLLNSSIVRARDFNFDIFGFMTLEKSYLLKCYDNKDKKYEIVETPQFLIMRVAIGIHGEDMDSVIKTYELMSNGYFTHATPTLFNAGTRTPQLASCFLFQIYDDSIDGIYHTLRDMAKISQSAGGIGSSVSNVRATNSYIKGTGGRSNGLIPMLRVFNETARYVDQGGGKRMGSFAMYLEPWHDDVLDFLDLKKNTGKEELRARDLFYAIWMNDLFMQRVEKDEMWSLMCPNECPGLQEAYAEDFVELYTKYESEGKFRRQMKAREIWGKILDSQIETGTPYMLYKDSANVKSNQKNIGTITNSNLCLVGDTNVDVRITYINNETEIEEGSINLSELNLVFNNEEISLIEIKSKNIESGEIEYQKVLASALTNPSAQVIKITDESTGKFIECTEDHQIWTNNRGYVKAGELLEDDILDLI